MNSIIYTPLFLENTEELFNIILQETSWTKKVNKARISILVFLE